MITIKSKIKSYIFNVEYAYTVLQNIISITLWLVTLDPCEIHVLYMAVLTDSKIRLYYSTSNQANSIRNQLVIFCISVQRRPIIFTNNKCNVKWPPGGP